MKNATARRMAAFEARTVQTFMECQDEFDDLVMLASRGDRRAIGAIATALGPRLLDVARAALKECEHEADDVVQDFMLAMLEERWPFTRTQGSAFPWMCGVVRMIARNRRRESLRQAGLEDDG